MVGDIVTGLTFVSGEIKELYKMMNENIKVKELSNEYDWEFRPDQEYLDSMPDIQNSKYSPTLPIERVGIHNFYMPLMVRQKNGGTQEVQAQITGFVSLEADKAGINMSRIIRTAYKSLDTVLDIDSLCKLLENYKRDLQSFEAHILLKFKYRLWQEALRTVKEDGTKEGGWQYYDVTFDVDLNRNGEFRKVMYLDFVYSSACPCSTALSQHAALTRGKYAIPHSQRSVARIGVEFENFIWIEDLINKCRESLRTEVLVFCKRQDEQAFAELNASQPKFVEDAARILAGMLNKMVDVKDYKIVVSHQESLHGHDAISIMLKGNQNSKFTADVSFEELCSMTK